MIKFFIILVVVIILLFLMRIIKEKYFETSSEIQEEDIIQYNESEIVSPKKTYKPFFDRSDECMSMEEIQAELRKHDTSYRLKRGYNKYRDDSFSVSNSSYDNEIDECPICGSTDFVGGYCEDCGWIE